MIRRPEVVVLLLALAAHAWVLWLPFQLDDYTVIHALLQSGPQSLVAGAAGTAEDSPERLYLFRPATWGLWLLGDLLSPRPLAPWIFHLLSLLVHSGAAILLCRILLRKFAVPSAVAGASIFALTPIGSQAVSWVAAAGDVLMTLAALLAAAVLVGRNPNRARATLAGVALALGLFAKESGLALMPLAAAYVGLRPRAGALGQRAIQCGFLVLPFAAAYVARGMVTTWSLHYAGGMRADFESLPRMLAKIPDFLTYLGAPWLAGGIDLEPPLAWSLARRFGAALGLEAWPLWASVSLVLPAAALASSPRKFLTHAVPAVLAAAVLLVPPAFAAPQTPGCVSPRSLHVLTPLVAWLVAASVDAIRGSGGAGRRRGRWVPILLVPIVFTSVDAMVHQARCQLRSREHIRGRLEAIEAAAAEPGSAEVGVVVVDPLVGVASDVPMLGPLVPWALAEPFRSPAIRAFWFATTEEFARAPSASAWRGRLVVLQAVHDRLTKSGPTIPALPERDVKLVDSMSPSPGITSWTPDIAIPPRAVRGVRLRLPPGPEVSWSVRLVSDAITLERGATTPGSASVRELAFDLDAGWEWIAGTRLLSVSLSGAGFNMVEPPRLLAEPPSLGLRREGRAGGLEFGDVPTLCITGLAPDAGLRVEFEIFGDGRWAPAIEYRLRPEQLARSDGGTVTWTPSPGDEATSPLHPALRWETVPALFETYLAPRGVRELRWRLRAAALAPGGNLIIARSPWVIVAVGR